MLLGVDGMGHYDTPWIPRKWTSLTTPAVTSTWTIEATGRENNCIQKVTGNGGAVEQIGWAPLMTRTGAWVPTASGVCGFAAIVNDLALIDDSGQSPIPAIWKCYSGPNAQITIRLNSNGTFSLVRNDASPVTLQHSAEGVLSNTWFEFEVLWVISNTVGAVQVRVNRVPILTITGADTQANLAPLANWNSIALLGMPKLGGGGTDLIWRFCDFYFADLTAAVADDVAGFLGVFPIDFIVPDGAGASTGWTPSTGANWECVDEVPPSVADYVAATAPGALDLYDMQDIPPGTVVLGTQQLILAAKEDPGGATIEPVYREGGVNYVYPLQGVPSEDPYYIIQPIDVNPATLAKFTAAEINAGQFGQNKES